MITKKFTAIIIHESRHGFQQAAAQGDKSLMVSTPTRNAWEYNLNNYTQPPPRPPANATPEERDERHRLWLQYRNQALEVDTFSFMEGDWWNTEQ